MESVTVASLQHEKTVVFVQEPAAWGRWLVQLNAMRASAEIDDEQARQLSFDLDCAYSEFHRDLAGRH